MAIDERHSDYSEEIADWRKIEHITRMKELSRYLLALNPSDTSQENSDRNEQYGERAIFYAIAGETAKGLLGTMFADSPAIQIPTYLDYLIGNADGAGMSLNQFAQGLADDVLRKGRAGIAVGFPTTGGEVSVQDRGRFFATLQRYEPEQVINWRTETVGAETRLKLVVIEESVDTEQDDYSVETHQQIREMFLEDGVYRERLWSEEKGWRVISEFTPRDANGSSWDLIPFQFVGSENNDWHVDRAPLLPLVELNVGHYRNSADWEDSVWYAGQAQPFMTGITEDFLRLMNEHNMYVGSRQVLGVPSGETFGFAAAPPNPIVREAMRDKVEMALQLGARLIQPGSGAKTATEVAGIREAQHSVLSMISHNVSQAITQAIRWAARYMSRTVVEENIRYEIGQEFVRPEATPAELQQIIAGFVQGAVPMGDYVRYMKQHQLFDPDKTVEDYAVDLDQG